jgi:cytochrome c-type biogenesis protein CcmH/NrfF
MRLPLLLGLALLLGAGAAAAAGKASEARSEDVVRAKSSGWSEELEHDLMSPYCPGRSLTECPSPQATELRLWIQAQERAGVPREQVEARLFQEYGDKLRHGPRAEGWGLSAYLVPAAALAAGFAFVFVFLRRQARPVSDPVGAARPRDPASAAKPRDPELERRLDEELGATS